ncbi:hypothetical protein [Phenylobacterium sp.]|uniref:hypothetical protein n=1 Tax=Phenylobacterium sp. TaxID=1871053 RepID=UPI00121BC141|nr:hypothetical protein [Phenylobacterium sp.]THD58912.1 MAG: hypothetical protein E8A49_18160 [Phenylobacterium sp.]
MAVKARLKAEGDGAYQAVATAFDGAFYWTVNPDLRGAELDVVRHYLTAGWREGRDPAPWFSTRAYMEAYPEVAEAGWNPFHHYLVRGRGEGREVVRSAFAEAYLLEAARRGAAPAWSFQGLGADGPIARARDADRAVAGQEFDADFYLAVNPDVAKTGYDPLDHFLTWGWREGRDPNEGFSLAHYVETNPDVAAAGINPFVHYLAAGRAEGRTPRLELGFRYEIIKRLAPLAEHVALVERAAARLAQGDEAQLAAALAARARAGLAALHVTFSHDDYTANTGGVQLCLQREGARMAQLGRDHLHLYPAKPWPVVRQRSEAGPLGVLLNGQAVGFFAAATVAAALSRAAGRDSAQRSFAIHSLLGHNAGETAEIVEALGLSAGFFWLHDFASLCAGYHLLRDDVADCAAPPPGSAACGICVYGPWRARHIAEHERLFGRLSLTVVSPAATTLGLWKARAAVPVAGEVVLPHARLVDRGPAPPTPANRPLRIAYVGMPSAHKGWEVFRDLIVRHAADPRYRFLHLGGRTQPRLPLEFHKVSVSEAAPNAMRDAIARHEVDAVLIWPLCRETFSFTAYEAVAGGAAVITGPDSGNVAAFVAGTGHGQVLADEAALAQAFDGGGIAALSRAARRPQLYDLAFSGLTAELLEAAG